MLPKIVNTNLKIFLLFWIGITFCYLCTWQYGIYADFADTMYMYRNHTFTEFINREGIVNISMYQGTLVILYALISILGDNPLPWFLLFTLLHTCCGVLVYSFFKRYFTTVGLLNAQWVALVGVVLLLFAPIVSEVVIWKACFHYYTAIGIIFIILHKTLTYINAPKLRNALLIWVLYYASTFMLELHYLTPVFVCIVILSLLILGSINRLQAKKGLLYIFLPLVILWVIYLLTYFTLYNKWIAHYDLDITQSLGIPQIMSSVSKTLLRIYCFEYLLPHHLRMQLLEIVSSPLYGWISAGIVSFLGILFVVKFNKIALKGKLIGVLIILGFASCILIIPLWYNDLNMFLNNRYYYLPGIFFFMLLALIVIPEKGKTKWYQNVFLVGYFVFALGVTFSVVKKVNTANTIYQSVFTTYDFSKADTIIFLNMPNNLAGINIIPSENGEDFQNYYYIVRNNSLPTHIINTYSHNVNDKNYGVHITVLDSMQFKVSLNQYGTWWWCNSLGASNRENELFYLSLTEDGTSYTLTLKRPISKHTKLLYHNNLQWKEVDRLKIEVTQY